jgi:PIN domain nuclease of toxin-antitoxin system
MRILLDTQALAWWFSEPGKLSKRAVSIITNAENAVLVSAASAWELAIKVNLAKWTRWCWYRTWVIVSIEKA